MLKPFSLMLMACLICRVANGAESVPHVNDLIRDLRAVDYEVRVQAAETLGRLGPSAAPAVRALASAVFDPRFEVQAEALIALERIGPPARSAVPALIAVLKGEDAHLFGFAINALGAIGNSAAAAKPELARFMLGDHRQLSVAACRALLHIRPLDDDLLPQCVRVLIVALTGRDDQAARDAVDVLGLCGSTAVPGLARIVETYAAHAESAARGAAALKQIGRHAVPAVPALGKALQSRNEMVVEQSIGALAAIGPSAGPAVPELRALLTSPSASIRTHVASALGDIGAVAAVNDLATALEDRDEDVRRESAQALGKIGPPAKPAIPALLRALEDPADSVKWHVAEALSRIGEAAVVPLIERLSDKHLQYAAVIILGDIGPAAHVAVRPLLQLMSRAGHSTDLEREIVLALSRIGPAAKEAVPTLLAILGDEANQARSAAAWALAKIGAKETIPQLIAAFPKSAGSDLAITVPIAVMILNPEDESHFNWAREQVIGLLKHDSKAVRTEAALALATVGAKAAAAIPDLAAGLKDPDPAIRNAFLTTLAAIGPESVGALPAIGKALGDPVDSVRSSASHAVGMLGPAAKLAIPLLVQNLQREDPFLQFASAWALVRVEPQRERLAEECLAPLRRGLVSSNPQMRSDAAQTLGLLGSAAAKAMPDLEALAADGDENIRKSAQDAIQKIGHAK
ncbi:MAG TPA: HEAT repeat domain-containing protein [Planctomycetaceae bacterium]|jgi:HEAT repeat protein